MVVGMAHRYKAAEMKAVLFDYITVYILSNCDPNGPNALPLPSHAYFYVTDSHYSPISFFCMSDYINHV